MAYSYCRTCNVELDPPSDAQTILGYYHQDTDGNMTCPDHCELEYIQQNAVDIMQNLIDLVSEQQKSIMNLEKKCLRLEDRLSCQNNFKRYGCT